jgi:hypothetical protein
MNQPSRGSVDDKAGAGRLPQGDPARALEAEALRVARAGSEMGVALRLIGSLAVRYHCPQLTQEIRPSRICADIDFAGYGEQSEQIRKVFASLGYDEDIEINVLRPGAGRLIFSHPETRTHADVFLDELNFCHPFRREHCRRGRVPQTDVALERATFCHPIPWTGRLEVDDPTIPLAELLLETLTVPDIDESDFVEAITLLGGHEVAQDDADHVNGAQVAELCAQQWGLWHDCSTNLAKVGAFLPGAGLSDDERVVVSTRIATLLRQIDECSKGPEWHEQAKVAGRIDERT